jgi:molybdopterin molybdotransferase
MSLSVEKALEIALGRVSPLPTMEVPLESALGYILAEDVVSERPQPPFDRSPLDGYALCHEDSIGAREGSPARLSVAFTTFAGGAPERKIGRGECARIMTGAMLPEGADCVVRQEDTDEGSEEVLIYRELGAHENYVFAGEDYPAGETLLNKGIYLDAAALAVCASAGKSTVSIYTRPRAAVISTGDEIVEPGKALPRGKIYNSNLIHVSARLRELGCEVTFASAVGDDKGELEKAFKTAVGRADIIFSTGGVSVGQKDLVPAALDGVGAETVFHGVAMKPGMPTLFALLSDKPVLALSGNPFAAAVALELIGAPLVCRLSSRPSDYARAEGVLQNPFEKASPGRRFVRAVWRDGRVTLPEGHSNGVLRSLVGCNCLVDVPAGSGALAAGEKVRVILFRGGR